MRILITSGGTKIPIDEVRSITNMSSGTFGAKIGAAALNRGHELYFVTHKSAKTPLKRELDLDEVNAKDVDQKELSDWIDWAYRVRSRYYEFKFDTYDDYYSLMKEASQRYNADAIILAAAVSDYGVSNPIQGKMRTENQRYIELEELPKIISKIRNEWGYKGILVGFKLLLGAKRSELVESAQESLVKNDCDFVIANDLYDIKKGDHRIIIVEKNVNYTVSERNSIFEILSKIEYLDNDRRLPF